MTTDEELLDAWPRVRIDRDNAAYFRGLMEQQLLINRCGSCRTWHHPPRSVCPRCWSNEIVAEAVSGRGTIDLLTFLHQGPNRPGVDYSGGYPVVAVGLAEQPGLRVAATIVGAGHDDITLGAAVEIDWERYDGGPSPVFRLADATEGSRA